MGRGDGVKFLILVYRPVCMPAGKQKSPSVEGLRRLLWPPYRTAFELVKGLSCPRSLIEILIRPARWAYLDELRTPRVEVMLPAMPQNLDSRNDEAI